jgi:hypothetical protein
MFPVIEPDISELSQATRRHKILFSSIPLPQHTTPPCVPFYTLFISDCSSTAAYEIATTYNASVVVG